MAGLGGLSALQQLQLQQIQQIQHIHHMQQLQQLQQLLAATPQGGLAAPQQQQQPEQLQQRQLLQLQHAHQQQQLQQQQVQQLLLERQKLARSLGNASGPQTASAQQTAPSSSPLHPQAPQGSGVKIEGDQSRPSSDVHPDLDYDRAPPDVVAALVPADPDERDEKCSLLQPRRGRWVYAVRGPPSELQRLCESRPAAKPVGWLQSMRHACDRWGLVTATRASCVEVCVHNPSTPGRPLTFWLPREAVGLPPRFAAVDADGTDGNGALGDVVHRARVLDDRAMVETLCNTKPEESPVTFVKSIALVVGKEGDLLESRGNIVKLRFSPRRAESQTTSSCGCRRRRW